MNEIKNVSIYLRKSRQTEGLTDAESLDNHRETLTELCKANGWEYVIYEEIGSSMSTDNRPEFQAMLSMINWVDAVVVMDIDRLSRDRYESARIMQHFKRTDTKIVTADGRITDLNNDQEEIMTGMQEVFANYEYNQIKKRLQRGKEASAAKGNWASGRTPLGYQYNRDTKKLDINPEESVIVQKAFNMYSMGFSIYDIVVDLNQQGYRTRSGKPFKADGMGHILKNEAYIGNPVQRGVRHEGAAPAIVDEVTFRAVQRRFENGAYRKGRGTAQTHGLSALVRCGYCDHVHRIQVNKGGKNSKFKKSYKVLRGCYIIDTLTGELCKNKGINYDKLMQHIVKEVAQQRDVVLKAFDEMKTSASSLQKAREDKLQQLLDNKAKLCSQIDKINSLILEEVFSPEEGLKMKSEKQQQIEEIDSAVEHLQDTTLETEAEIMRRYLDKLDSFLNPTGSEVFTEQQINDLLTSIILNIKLYNLGGETPRIVIEWR